MLSHVAGSDDATAVDAVAGVEAALVAMAATYSGGRVDLREVARSGVSDVGAFQGPAAVFSVR